MFGTVHGVFDFAASHGCAEEISGFHPDRDLIAAFDRFGRCFQVQNIFRLLVFLHGE